MNNYIATHRILTSHEIPKFFNDHMVSSNPYTFMYRTISTDLLHFS